MQVSIACTEHNLKSRNGEDRLLSKQSSTAPNVVNAARAKFRTVAIIARSLGTFTPQHHISLKESTAKQTGMKYRYGRQIPSARGLCVLYRCSRDSSWVLKSDLPTGELPNLEFSGVSKIVPLERGNPKWLCCVCIVFLKMQPILYVLKYWEHLRGCMNSDLWRSTQLLETGIEIRVVFQEQMCWSCFMVQTEVSVIILFKLVSHLVLHSDRSFKRPRQ